MPRVLRDPLQHPSGAASPAERLRLVPARQVEQREEPRDLCGFGWSGFGPKGVERSSAQAQRVLGAAEPPHGVEVGCVVIGRELLGRHHPKVRSSGGPVMCGVGLPRVPQGVPALVHLPSSRHPPQATGD